jgi:NADH-quinone oxidoreductase subunit J
MLTFAACVLAGAAAVGFAALMVFQRSLYAAAICLLAVILQSSVLFFLVGSPLLAFLQVMVYAGAVMVLVVVTIMAAPEPMRARWSGLSIPKWLAAAGLLLPVVEVVVMLAQGATAPITAGIAGTVAHQEQMGAVLFGPYAIATESVGILLFVAALALVDARSAS